MRRNNMKKFLYTFFITLVFTFTLLGQRTDLTGIKICIDPGHGGHNEANDRHVVPDPGTDFWESESNLQKAFLLKPMLEAKGAWVILTRYTNDYPNDDEPTLGERSALANANNVTWFHSIHSNAYNGATNYTLVLLKENIDTRQAQFPAALTMSDIIGRNIKNNLRSGSTYYVRLDYTFYGGPNGGYNLGVLKGANMPNELSEGSFHDYYPETRRLMNNDYRKMEAYALRNSFMEYFQAPSDSFCIIAGLIKDEMTATPINQVKVTLLPLNKTYICDNYNNGFYMFDSLKAGSYSLVFEKIAYAKDTVKITITNGSTNFLDKNLVNSVAPMVLTSTLKDGDTTISATSTFKLTFSKQMDTASVRNAISFTPAAQLSLTWQNTNKDLTITPANPLKTYTNYTLKIDTSAKDYKGFQFDGNGDGVPGDPYILKFKTLSLDAEAPIILSTYPTRDSKVTDFSTHGIISIVFNKKMDTSSIVNGGVALRKFSATVPSTFSFTEYDNKTILHIKPAAALEKSSQYVVIAYTTVKDIFTNSMKSVSYFYFTTNDRSYKNSQTIESFSTGIGNWKSPTYSGSTVGVATSADSTNVAEESNIYLPGTGDTKSMKLQYTWLNNASSYLIREYSGATSILNVLIDTSFVLQSYIFGDGSNNKIRFCVDDSSTYALHKVNNWITIDWIGWKLIEWKLTNPNEMGSWLNTGYMVGPKNRFDSYQLTYDPVNGKRSSAIYIDELRMAEIGTPVKVEKLSEIPQQYLLKQNYPNPFNPSTKIAYSIPHGGFVNLKIYNILGKEICTLINENQESGTYTINWNAVNEPNGVYFARLNVAGKIYSIKMMLLK
jgi:N-acetylmuramoyl-L-alanine amidase